MAYEINLCVLCGQDFCGLCPLFLPMLVVVFTFIGEKDANTILSINNIDILVIEWAWLVTSKN